MDHSITDANMGPFSVVQRVTKRDRWLRRSTFESNVNGAICFVDDTGRRRSQKQGFRTSYFTSIHDLGRYFNRTPWQERQYPGPRGTCYDQKQERAKWVVLHYQTTEWTKANLFVYFFDRDDPRTDRKVKLAPVKDCTICPISLLLILALRTGATQETIIIQVLKKIISSPKGNPPLASSKRACIPRVSWVTTTFRQGGRDSAAHCDDSGSSSTRWNGHSHYRPRHETRWSRQICSFGSNNHLQRHRHPSSRQSHWTHQQFLPQQCNRYVRRRWQRSQYLCLACQEYRQWRCLRP